MALASETADRNDYDFSGRTVLITGASRGIGRALSVGFARAGAHVIALARTTGALEELDDEIRDLGGEATLVPMNLKGSKLDMLGPSLAQRWEAIDVVIGNAGVLGPLSPLGHIEQEAWDEVMQVNVTANWRLLRTMDPLLRQAEAGRAIFVTSGAAENCRPYWGPYSVSKAALEALVKTYAAECASTSVRANLVSPGPVATGMRAKAMPGEDPASITQPADLVPVFLELASPDCVRNGELIAYQKPV